MRILLVEDDTLLADAVARALTQAAHAVDVVRTGEEADRALAANRFDLVILDVGLPGMDGFEVLKRLRGRRSDVPVLVLTARDSVEDRVTGLDLGADDYLTKPFHLAELEARVRALIRRGHQTASGTIVHGRLRFDAAGRRLYCDELPVDLSSRELAVLELLLMRVGRVVTKQQIADHLYGWGDEVSSNAIEVFVHRLRRKLEPMGANIRTVRGMGYLIDKAHDD
ncbi:response regulator [Pelomicrobium methylotrophicum]|uniref:Response regulator transcription factor n=1 Tax=Pelomicrobium methylotrophicum TaxID=2602750 RepID=A0A5C7ELT0_9PROT|nr:response regulator transcription factor [Pelomicrobium methylotrophicum]TXF12363.1 response regulator transcription factor [Pelomicrobium methylotrophicum]